MTFWSKMIPMWDLWRFEFWEPQRYTNIYWEFTCCTMCWTLPVWISVAPCNSLQRCVFLNRWGNLGGAKKQIQMFLIAMLPITMFKTWLWYTWHIIKSKLFASSREMIIVTPTLLSSQHRSRLIRSRSTLFLNYIK